MTSVKAIPRTACYPHALSFSGSVFYSQTHPTSFNSQASVTSDLLILIPWHFSYLSEGVHWWPSVYVQPHVSSKGILRSQLPSFLWTQHLSHQYIFNGTLIEIQRAGRSSPTAVPDTMTPTLVCSVLGSPHKETTSPAALTDSESAPQAPVDQERGTLVSRCH